MNRANRVFFSISNTDIQAIIVEPTRSNNSNTNIGVEQLQTRFVTDTMAKIIAIQRLEFNGNWQNPELLSKTLRNLIVKLEQSCNETVTEVNILLHGFIDWTYTPASDRVCIGSNTYCTVNNINYSTLFDINNSLPRKEMNIYVNENIIHYIQNIFLTQYLQIKNIYFAPLYITKCFERNTAVCFLYKNKIVICVKHNYDIKIHTFDNIETGNVGDKLSFLMGNVENVTATRRFIMAINDKINQCLHDYNNITVYFTNDFAYFVDLIEYMQFINNEKYNYEWLEYKIHSDQNPLWYSGMIIAACNTTIWK